MILVLAADGVPHGRFMRNAVGLSLLGLLREFHGLLAVSRYFDFKMCRYEDGAEEKNVP
jgi:hypothetical protein